MLKPTNNKSTKPSNSDASHKTWCPPEPAPGAICGYVGGVGPFYTRTTRSTVRFDTPNIARSERRAGDPENHSDASTNSNISSAYASCVPTRQRHCVEVNRTISDITENSSEYRYQEDVRQYSKVVLPSDRYSYRKLGSYGTDTDTVTQNSPPVQSLEYHADESSLGLSDVRHVQFVEENFDWRSLRSGSNSQKHASVWMSIAIGALVLSNMFYLTAFVTNSWGVMKVWSVYNTATVESMERRDSGEINKDDVIKQWNFGLWQCCRNDGLCLGTRWPVLYVVTRTCAVFSLFGHALALAWTLGHTVEKLLLFDPCTMTTLSSMCFITGTFSLIAVSCFGSLWPSQFQDILRISSSNLGYSFYFAAFSVPLTYVAGAGTLIDFRSSWSDLQAQFDLGRTNEIIHGNSDDEDSEDVSPGEDVSHGDAPLSNESHTLLNKLGQTTAV